MQRTTPAVMKPNNMTPFRLAKKAKGLASMEKRALLAIADACSMSEGVCRKSMRTLNDEHSIPNGSFHYGIGGRKRKDGGDYFPGLIRRGIIVVVSGGKPSDGVPTVYRINTDVLRTYCDGNTQPKPNQNLANLSKNEGVTSPQTSPQMVVNLSTNESKPLHIEAKTSPHVETSSLSSSKDSSKDLIHIVHKPESKHASLNGKTKSGGQENLKQSTMQRIWTEDDFKKYPTHAEYLKAIKRQEGIR